MLITEIEIYLDKPEKKIDWNTLIREKNAD